MPEMNNAHKIRPVVVDKSLPNSKPKRYSAGENPPM